MSWTKRLIEEMQEGMSEKEAQAYVAQKRREQEHAWSVSDFEERAKELEKNNYNGEEVFDRDQFPYALSEMIEALDGEHGITWDTIDAALDDYCKGEHVCSCGETKDPDAEYCRECAMERLADWKADRDREDRLL